MSQLAQTRLTPLTQKCLPSAIWRQKAYSTTKQTSTQAPPLTTTACPYPYESSDISLKLPISNRSKHQESSYHRLGFGQKPLGYLFGLPNHDLTAPTIRSLSSHTIKADDFLFKTIRLDQSSQMMYENVPYCESQNKNSEILLSNHEPLDRLDRFKQFRSSIWSRGYTKQAHHNNERANEDGHHKNRHKNLKYLAPSLGILGFMTNGSNVDGDDDDRSKLTDAEKMKKMSPAELLIAKGVLSLCDHDHDKADKMFHEALQYAIAEHNVDQETLILNLLATNFLESGDLKKAEKLLIDLIKRLVAQEVDQSDSAILELSLKLASIYGKCESDHEKAYTGFRFVINNLTKKLEYLPLENLDAVDLQDLSEQQKNDLAMLGWACDWFAKFLLSINDPSYAVSLLKRALNISTKILGCHHEQTLILLNDIGTTLSMSNLPEEGKYFIKRAVEGALESQSQELASFYVNLGIVNLQLMNLNEAQRYCEYSIELALKNHDHHNTTEVIKLSQNCLQQIKRLVEVEGG